MTRIRLVRMMMLALATCALIVVLITGCPSGLDIPKKKTDDPVGTTWTLVRTGGGLKSPAGTIGERLGSVAWGGGRFVAVGGGGTIVHSADGETWTAANVGATEDLADVIWGDGRFVAVTWNGTVVRSADGATWAAVEVSGAEQLRAVTYGGGRFVAVGPDGMILSSGDGEAWTASTDTATHDRLEGVAWGQGDPMLKGLVIL